MKRLALSSRVGDLRTFGPLAQVPFSTISEDEPEKAARPSLDHMSATAVKAGVSREVWENYYKFSIGVTHLIGSLASTTRHTT